MHTERPTYAAPWIEDRDYSYETRTRARVVRGLAFDGAGLHTLAHFADEDPAVVTLALAGLHELDPLADLSALTAEGARCRLHDLLRYLTR